MKEAKVKKILHVFYSKIHETDEKQLIFEKNLFVKYQLNHIIDIEFDLIFFNLKEIDFLRKNNDSIPDFIVLYELNTYRNLKKIVKIKKFYENTNYELISINNPYSGLIIKGSIVLN